VTDAGGPHLFPDRVPAWYVHTTDSVVLAGPFAGEAGARMAGTRVAVRMAATMRQDGGSSSLTDVRARVAKLRIGYGLRPKPDGRFEAVPPEDPGV
jgi:hypothetical protein